MLSTRKAKTERGNDLDAAVPVTRRASWVRALLCSGERVASWPLNLGLLLLRLPVGLALSVLHGWQKLPPSPSFLYGMVDRGFPYPYALAIACGVFEVLAGVCLALGLLTRWAGLTIAVICGVALVKWHASDALPQWELPVLYLTLACFFLLAGGGRFSMDALLRRLAPLRPPAPSSTAGGHARSTEEAGITTPQSSPVTRS